MISKNKYEIPGEILENYLSIVTKKGCTDLAIINSIAKYISLGDASNMMELLLKDEQISQDLEDNSGEIYILKWGYMYKIGRSKNAQKRFNQIRDEYSRVQPVMPYEIELIHIIETTNMYESEKILHKNFENKRVNGEWFELNETEIDEILKI